MKLLLVILLAVPALTMVKEEFYPFGDEQGDERLSVGDDLSSEEIQLHTPIAFFDSYIPSLYVNLNGHITFGTDLPNYDPNLIIPFGIKTIAIFLSDVDTRITGNVYYRESADPSLLDLAASEVRKSYPEHQDFQPSRVFIATWDVVGYFEEGYDKTNSYQIVLASDARHSFCYFHYARDLGWTVSDGKYTPYNSDVPAQAGFDPGDRRPAYTLKYSGTQNVEQLASDSNVDKQGKWVFRIGNLFGGNIEEPKRHTPSGGNEVESHTESCATGASQCSQQADCVDVRQGGFCCECQDGYFGNGFDCIQKAAPLRVNGKVTGVLNGQNLEEKDMHAYILTKDGRTYTAVGGITPALGYGMQALYPMGGILGFLFASSTQPRAPNGYTLAGGDLTRTATIRFTSTNQTVTVQQTFTGQSVVGHMVMDTIIRGNVPNIAAGASLTVPDYNLEFRRTDPGTIQSFSRHSYKVDGVPYSLTVDQTLLFTECEARPLDDLAALRLSVSRAHVVFQEKEELVRYSMANKMSVAGADPCLEVDENFCHRMAHCVAVGSQARCRCNDGYEGDGSRCRDVDECRSGAHNCDTVHGECVNTAGAFQCRCPPGFTLSENGFSCEQQDSCDVVQNCDANARCLYDPNAQQYRCICGDGWRGDGYSCIKETCDVINDCAREADCVYDEDRRQYYCLCRQGYYGDGYLCSAEGCDVNNYCDPNADCVYDQGVGRYTCRCRYGFEGDGMACRQQTEGDSRSYLMYTQEMSIMEVPFVPSEQDKGRVVLYIPGQKAIGLDVDCYSRYFYWTDVSGKIISRAKLDGTDSEVLVTGLGSPEGVAVDWISRTIYWTDSVTDSIEVARLDGTYRKTIVSEGLVNPRGIVVDPRRGYVFWTDWNREAPKIERSNMDGTGRTVLVEDNLGLPNGITIDYSLEKICWADAGTQNVECVDYNGRGRQSIYALASYPFDVVLANDRFYWTDWDTRSLPNIERYGSGFAGEPLTLPLGANGKMYGITAVNSQCPAGTNACALNNGGCTYLCLPTPNGGRECACPDDVGDDECQRLVV